MLTLWKKTIFHHLTPILDISEVNFTLPTVPILPFPDYINFFYVGAGLAVWREQSLARSSTLTSTLQGELSTTRLYCFRGAENFRNNMHYVNHRVFDEDMKVQFKTTNKYRIFWPITVG